MNIEISEQEVSTLVDIFQDIDKVNVLLLPNLDAYIIHFFGEISHHISLPDNDVNYFSSLDSKLLGDVFSEYLDDLMQSPEKLADFTNYIKLRMAINKWMESLGL